MTAPALNDFANDPRLTRDEAYALTSDCSLDTLMRSAAARRDTVHGAVVTYSRKVFIPLTQLCRDVCHYCTFAHGPRKGERAYLTL
ncbi:MAG: fbiC, partial [Betaproteobacteria bacterium]|nr:fbiC [Betaproteobacteria bacterium]